MSLSTSPCPNAVSMLVHKRLHKVLAIHFDPDHGTPFWLQRAADLGFDPRRTVHSPADLARFGDMTPSDLSDRPLAEFVPRRFHDRLEDFVVGKTGGTTGAPVWTAYRRDEFEEAFVRPFTVAATQVGFPRGAVWLFVGPSGPHIIGKAAPALARSMGSPDPFSVDFDPLWAKTMPDGSFAQRRYLAHVVEQAMAVLDREPVGVLFATPPVLMELGSRLTPAQREGIVGVHYGGMSVAPDELQRFQLDGYPNAVHLSGYGNTLFGCCLELNIDAGRTLDYFPRGDRLLLDVVDESGMPMPAGMRGRVRFSRLDESFLLINMLERDEAALVVPPQDAPGEFSLPGVRDPSPRRNPNTPVATGLY